jgi:hypothetical protein
MYIPKNTDTLKDKQQPQIRLLLQGWPGTGKTHAALTFPNPYVLDFDNNLQAYYGKDIPNYPIWNSEFVTKTLSFPPTKPGAQPNRRDAALKFLREEATKFTPDQTLIVDSWSRLQAAIDAQNEMEPKITKEGKIDDFHFWKQKLDYSREFMQLLCSVKCHVIVTVHEIAERDPKSGALLDKVRPLQQGKFLAELASYFTYVFRAVTEEQKDTTGKVVKTNYLWQVATDNQFEAIARPSFPDGTYRIPASYDELVKYRISNSNA